MTEEVSPVCVIPAEHCKVGTIIDSLTSNDVTDSSSMMSNDCIDADDDDDFHVDDPCTSTSNPDNSLPVEMAGGNNGGVIIAQLPQSFLPARKRRRSINPLSNSTATRMVTASGMTTSGLLGQLLPSMSNAVPAISSILSPSTSTQLTLRDVTEGLLSNTSDDDLSQPLNDMDDEQAPDPPSAKVARQGGASGILLSMPMLTAGSTVVAPSSSNSSHSLQPMVGHTMFLNQPVQKQLAACLPPSQSQLNSMDAAANAVADVIAGFKHDKMAQIKQERLAEAVSAVQMANAIVTPAISTNATSQLNHHIHPPIPNASPAVTAMSTLHPMTSLHQQTQVHQGGSGGPVMSRPGHGLPAQPLHLVGGSCIYCGFEIKKPWDLVTHMVEHHDVQIANLTCGDALPINSDLSCTFCGTVFRLAHDLYYHLLTIHAKRIFGKEAMADFCAVEMLTSDHKKLTLKVRINRREVQPQQPPPDPEPSRQDISNSVTNAVNAVAAAGLSNSLYPVTPTNTARGSFNNLIHPSPATNKRPMMPLRAMASTSDDSSSLISDEVLAEAEAQVRMHQKGFQCSQCFKIRQSREDAIAHVYKCHMTLRKYACPHCPKNYDNLKNLQTHVNACHTQQRLYQCQNCPMKYKYPGDLKRHLSKGVCDRYKTGGYPCPKCGILWYHQSALASHQRQCDGGAGAVLSAPILLDSSVHALATGALQHQHH